MVDESHRMKNPKAKQTKAIQKVSELVKHHILLSGTAVKNKKEELFTQLEVVAPGKFTSKNQIKFATIGGLWRDMKDFYIARSKEEVLKDVVWVIRNFKPDVIITRFPVGRSGGHGHHTASALLPFATQRPTPCLQTGDFSDNHSHSAEND